MRFGSWIWGAVAGMAALLPMQAQAQTQPGLTRQVTITFDATVTRSAGDTLQVRDATGQLSNYTGPLPAYPLETGDQLTFTINAALPTRAYYDDFYQGTPASDGLYKLPLTSGTQAGSAPFIGITSFSVSDPLRPALNFGQPTTTRLGVVYDYLTDSYSLDPGTGFVSGAYEGPGFLYDAASGQFVSCSGSQSCRGSAASDPVIFSLAGSPDFATVSSSNVRVNSTDPFSPMGTGLFSLLFSGNWSLPVFGRGGTSGGGTSVPEPGMMLLFGPAAGMVLLRRRRKTRAA